MNVRSRIEDLHIEKRAFINGKYVNAKSKAVMKKEISADGSILEGIAVCDERDIDLAVQAAKVAFPAWSAKTPCERKDIMLRLAGKMEEHLEELAMLDAYETGRAYQNYRDDSLPKAIEALRYFAEAVDKVYDTAIPARGSEFGVVRRVPLGVVGAITPWNDPMVVDTWKYAPALLMGNTVVMKPAEQSSLSLIRLAGLAYQAGVPAGVFNVVPGYGETAGKALALHPDVRGIFFTGSSEVGKLMLQYSGQSNMKKVGLECGGKGPYIVTANCRHVEEAAEVLAANMFYNQGQICSAPSRVIVDSKVADEFVLALQKAAEDFVPGDPFDDENRVGCVVSREQYDKVNGYIESARQNGANVWQAGSMKKHADMACCIQPTVITGVTNGDKVAREEVFGPVVVVLEADDTEEALKMANDTDYGLAGAVWTDDFDEACYVARHIETGLVHVNSYGNDDNSAPFGGVKQSGLGKDKSSYAFDEYSDLQTIWVHTRKA